MKESLATLNEKANITRMVDNKEETNNGPIAPAFKTEATDMKEIGDDGELAVSGS